MIRQSPDFYVCDGKNREVPLSFWRRWNWPLILGVLFCLLVWGVVILEVFG